MRELKEVMHDLEECLSASCRGFRPRLSCPYNDEEWDIMRDALEALKGKKVEAEIEGGGSTWWYVCSECHGAIDTNDKYCKHCGGLLKWE